jgi:hypothetical protein
MSRFVDTATLRGVEDCDPLTRSMPGVRGVVGVDLLFVDDSATRLPLGL